MSLTNILRRIRKELKRKNVLREKMLLNSRKITQQSKEAILLIHQNKLKKAEKRLTNVKKLLKSTVEFLGLTPELQTSGALFNACQEYAEASIFLALEKNENYPSPEDLGVSVGAYVLGLADVVGELRRKAVEAMKNGKLKKAEKCFKLMESIYSELMFLNEHAFSVLPGLRRKCDVARHLIELTRSDIVLEKRRKRLEDYLKFAEKSLPKLGK
ncbi:hypothetical protein CW703_05245 [Candidatus Bathyarchaeota archaeon]|nr:MAG: hypothetical protein B6U77_02530 [Candidatus Hecatellales archaeon ex4484_218]RJX15602.1 MAG: hypothetical protein CW703_05245 [Candidatus Bathyarchaeota archaeon]